MAERCEKCGRPYLPRANGYGGGVGPSHVTTCRAKGSTNCDVASAAYQRGLRAGVELAKEHAYAETKSSGYEISGASIEWFDVDAALAEKLGGGG
jgi:hypothetical protein